MAQVKFYLIIMTWSLTMSKEDCEKHDVEKSRDIRHQAEILPVGDARKTIF